MPDGHEHKPETVVVSYSCECHGGVVVAGCTGAVNLCFPVAMFLPGGGLQHRLNRSENLEAMARLYDRFAEIARLRLMEADPATERPPLENLGMTIITAPPWQAADDIDEEGTEKP